MAVKTWECGSCNEGFESKTKLRKHQKKQNPRHHGRIEKIIFPKSTTNTNQKTTGVVKSGKGNKPKQQKKKNQYTKSYKEEGPLEPTYQSGFFRIDSNILTTLVELECIPEGCEIHTVPETKHKIIEYVGGAYNAIDFLMYIHNFCELEMYYEDILYCLNDVPQMQQIGIKDMNELGVSIITFVDGDIIMSEYEETADSETITNQELLTSISKLNGVAIVFGKLKKDSTIKKTYTPPKKHTITPAKSVINNPLYGFEYDDDDDDDEDDVEDAKLCVDCNGKMSYDAVLVGNFCDDCGQEEEQNLTDLEEGIAEFFPDEDDFDVQWSSETQSFDSDIGQFGGSHRGYYWNQKNTYKPAVPVAEKYHPVFGIRGHNLLVDRIVDLTAIIESKDDEQAAETFEANTALYNERNSVSRKNTSKEIINQNQPQHQDRLNVAATPVDVAQDWAEKQFENDGLDMKLYIPHFKENYLSLQEECRLAIDIPRIEMPVIDPDDLNEFGNKLRAGALDVFEPFAIDNKFYSPIDLVKDTPDALNWLYLGYQDGNLDDDLVSAKITKTEVGLMRPTQSEIWLDKLIYSIIQWGEPSQKGAYNSKSKILKSTIAISQEGYILDGHHRYGQIALVNPTLKMQTLYIGLPIRRLLEVGRPYGNAIGNEQRAAEGSTEPR